MKFNIETFLQDSKAVAQRIAAADLFSKLSRSWTVPLDTVALLRELDGQSTLIPAGRAIDSDAAQEVLLARTTPFPLEFRFAELSCNDGFLFTAVVQLSLLIVPERTELAALAATVMGTNRTLSVSAIQQFWEPAVRAIASPFVAEQPASGLSSPVAAGKFESLLAERAKALCFEAGLALGRDLRIGFESADYNEHIRLHRTTELQKQRQAGEAEVRDLAAQARDRHWSQVSATLEKIRSQNQGLPVADIIKTFAPADRGDLYRGLMQFATPAKKTAAIVVAAGEELLWFDPQKPASPANRANLTSDLGPLRSIRSATLDGKSVLLVGARRGVHIVDVNGQALSQYSFDKSRDPRGGVNAATIRSDRLYATHSEIGLARWTLGSDASAELCLTETIAKCKSTAAQTYASVASIAGPRTGPAAIRDVQIDNMNCLWLSVDNHLIAWRDDANEPPTILETPAMIETTLLADGAVFAGLFDGRILRWWLANLEGPQTVRDATGSPVRSVQRLTGGGIPRLLIADGSPHVELMVIGDSNRGLYRAGQRIRKAFAAEDVIVGVNDRRDQIVLWDPQNPEGPQATINIGAICGHSVQDVLLLQRGD